MSFREEGNNPCEVLTFLSLVEPHFPGPSLTEPKDSIADHERQPPPRCGSSPSDTIKQCSQASGLTSGAFRLGGRMELAEPECVAPGTALLEENSNGALGKFVMRSQGETRPLRDR